MGNTMTDNLPPLPDFGPIHTEPSGKVEMYPAAFRECLRDVWKKGARAALAQVQSCVPAGYVLVAVQGLDALCQAMDRAESKGYLPDALTDEWEAFDYRVIAAAPQPQPVQPTTEAAFLRSQIALALEEMSCANFNSAAERLRHITEVAQAKPEQAAQPRPLSGEQASVMASYFNVPAELVHAVYNKAHGIAAPQPKD